MIDAIHAGIAGDPVIRACAILGAGWLALAAILGMSTLRRRSLGYRPSRIAAHYCLSIPSAIAVAIGVLVMRDGAGLCLALATFVPTYLVEERMLDAWCGPTEHTGDGAAG